MKVFTPNKFIFNLLLLLLSFEFILNDDGCLFKKTKESTPSNTLTDNIIEGITDISEAMQKCFSLSNSDVHQEKCCYDNDNKKCVDESVSDSVCPEMTDIPNNCGMAGIYKPKTKEICTEISLVQGYCCFVQIKNKGTACIRTKELNKDKNTVTDQMKQYIQDNNVNPDEIDFVLCKGNYIKYYWIFIIFAVILLK